MLMLILMMKWKPTDEIHLESSIISLLPRIAQDTLIQIGAQVLKLKLGLDQLKFKSSKNGAEMVRFGQRLSFNICFHFWSILS